MYLRAMISEDQLNYLAKLSIEHVLAGDIDYQKIIKTFADAKSRKVNFIK